MEHVAIADVSYSCAKCGFHMPSEFSGGSRVIWCPNEKCALSGRKFIVPGVRLEAVEEPENIVSPVPRDRTPNRFDAFNPDEREIMRVLLQEHSNAVSQCAIAMDVRVAGYLAAVEELEAEINAA